jgi:hypothetical protein
VTLGKHDEKGIGGIERCANAIIAPDYRASCNAFGNELDPRAAPTNGFTRVPNNSIERR